MSSVPNYSIAINGNSNDSDLVLGSVSGSITEYAGSIDLVPLTGKVNTLETSMNLVENNVNTLGTSMARKEFVWVSIVIKHDHSAGVYYGTPTTPLNDESIATLEAIKAHVLASVPGSDFNYIYDLSNQVRYEIYNIIDPSMQHDVLEAFFEAASVGNTSSVIREVKYTTMNPKVFGTYSTYKSYTESTDSIPTLSNLSSVAQTFINTNFSWVTNSEANNGLGASSVQEWWDTVFTYKNFTEQAALGTTGQVINYDNLETNVTTLETSMNSLETISDYKLSAGKGDIIYIADGINWASGKVANYIVAKLIQHKYPNKSVIASNYEIGGYTDGLSSSGNIHLQMGTGNADTPVFDAEFWGEPGFGVAVADISNGVTQNMYSVPNSAYQVDGFYVPDWVLNSDVSGMAALKAIVTAPGFNSNWGSTPPAGLVAAINDVIANSTGFGNYYAAPTWWGHTFESQADFDALGINVTVVYPADGADYGLTNYLANLNTRVPEPTTISGGNLFWGFAWLPYWIGSEGTTFIYSNFPSTTVKKLKGPLFETLFPAATAMYDAVDFTSDDIAGFSYDTDISGLSVVATGDKWLLDNSGATTDRVNTWLAATVTTTPASKFTPSTWLAATDIVTRNRTTTMETKVTTLETSMNLIETNVTTLETNVITLETSMNLVETTVTDLNEQNRKNRMANAIVKHRRTRTQLGTPYVFDSTNYWSARTTSKNLVIFFNGSGTSLDGQGTNLGIEKLSQTENYGGMFAYYSGTGVKTSRVAGDFAGSVNVDNSAGYNNEVTNVRNIINNAESELVDSSFDNITVVGQSKGAYLVNSLFVSQDIPEIKNYVAVGGKLDTGAVVYNDLSFVSDASGVTYVNIYDINDPYFATAAPATWNKYVTDLSTSSLGDISNITLLMNNSLTDLSSSHNFTVVDISGYSYVNNNRIINIETNNTSSDVTPVGIGSGTVSVKHAIGVNNQSSIPAPYSDIVLNYDGISDVVPDLLKILYNN